MKPQRFRSTAYLLLLALSLSFTSGVRAHDVWLQSNAATVARGQIAHLDLCLGNHGNAHRDFLLAGRVSLDWVRCESIAPDGSRKDLTTSMKPTAAAEKEGYWTAPLTLDEPGAHCFVQSLQRVMNHGRPVRGVRTAKCYVWAGDRDKISADGSRRPCKAEGLPFELVLQNCPFSEATVGTPVKVQLLLHGKPLSDSVVSFIPRGEVLNGEFDSRFECRTDDAGMAQIVPPAANLYLIVAHHRAEDERGDDYEFTSYATTVTLHVNHATAKR